MAARPHPSPGSWRPRTGLALVASVLFACSEPKPDRTGGRPVVLIGLDGADWAVLDPLVAAGKLPAFARLEREGRRGTLVATPPLLSPILWTTLATGRPPEDHGVLDFMVDLPSGGQAPVGASSRRVPALWNLFSAAGRRVAVIGWWATWPAENVRGTMVSDRVSPQLARVGTALDDRAVFPASLAARLTLVRAEQVPLESLQRYLPVAREEYQAAQAALRQPASKLYDHPIAHLAAVVAGTRTYRAAAEAALGEGQPDLLAVYLEGIDTLSHRFVRDPRHGPSAIEAAYRDADELLGSLAAASRPDTLVVVCSDHGFHTPGAGVTADPGDLTGPATAWHRPYGIVAVVEAGRLSGRTAGPTTPGPTTTITPLDLAPTVLHAAGLPVPHEMPGRVVTELLPEDLARRPVQRSPTPAYTPVPAPEAAADAEAWARLRALGYVGAGVTSSLARQNLGEILYRAGRHPAAERELRAVVEAQPQNLAAHLWLAKCLRAQGRDREALKIYDAALRLPGGAADALVEAVDVAVSAGLKEDARRLLETPAAPPAALQTARGIAALAEGRGPAAERELKAALAADPTSFEALSRLLDRLIPLGRAAEALPFARRAAGRAPASPRLRALLGEALLAARDPAGAARELTRALELASDSAAVRIDLARAQLALGQPAAAEATVEPAPAGADRSLVLAAAHAARERWVDAARELQSALEVGRETPDLLNGLGWAKLKLERRDEAGALFRRSLAINGRQPQIRRLLDEIEARAVSR